MDKTPHHRHTTILPAMVSTMYMWDPLVQSSGLANPLYQRQGSCLRVYVGSVELVTCTMDIS